MDSTQWLKSSRQGDYWTVSEVIASGFVCYTWNLASKRHITIAESDCFPFAFPESPVSYRKTKMALFHSEFSHLYLTSSVVAWGRGTLGLWAHHVTTNPVCLMVREEEGRQVKLLFSEAAICLLDHVTLFWDRLEMSLHPKEFPERLGEEEMHVQKAFLKCTKEQIICNVTLSLRSENDHFHV